MSCPSQLNGARLLSCNGIGCVLLTFPTRYTLYTAVPVGRSVRTCVGPGFL